MNGASEFLYCYPKKVRDLQEELDFQYGKLIQGFGHRGRGVYCFQKVENHSTQTRAPRFHYAPESVDYPAYIQDFRAPGDHRLKEKSDDQRWIWTIKPSPITLMLCGQNPEFQTRFINNYLALQNSNMPLPRGGPYVPNDKFAQEREKVAFKQAFEQMQSLPALSIDDPEILKIKNHWKSKPAYDLHSPKKLFMNALMEAAMIKPTDLAHHKGAIAQALFETAQHPRILQNTGFWAWIHSITQFFTGKKHQTKTFGFAKILCGRPTQAAQGDVLSP